MKRNIVIIGLGTFGMELALELSRKGHYVMAIDKDMQRINEIKDEVEIAVEADITDYNVLEKLEINQFDQIVIGTGDLESSILAITHLKKLKAKHIIVKANNHIQQEIFSKIGADQIILPEIESAQKLAEKISHPEILDKFIIDGQHSLIEIKVPRKFVGKNLIDLDLRRKYNINVIMINRNGKTILITDPSIVFEKDDTVFLLGEDAKIRKILED